MDRKRRSIWLIPVFVLLIALVIVGAVMTSRDGAPDSDTNPKDDIGALADELAGEPSKKDIASGQTRFLRDLERAAESASREKSGASARCVTWRDDTGLIEAGKAVLNSYASVPTARLSSSGYLDIKGDVWGAIVSDARGWVDMVVITSDGNDTSASIRIKRLLPKDVEGLQNDSKTGTSS